MRICFARRYDDAIRNLTNSLGADQTKWTWGEQVKARFPHPLGGAPLIGAQFTVPPFPQNGTGGSDRRDGECRSECVDAFDCGPERLGQDATRNRAWSIGIAEESALERSACGLARCYAARVSVYTGGGVESDERDTRARTS